MASPPEVHSALLSSGPGPGSLQAAASAWSALSAEYAQVADELTTLLGAVQAGTWDGPTAEAYTAAHTPYLAWLLQAGVNSATMAAQHETAATAYTTAVAAMPTLAELAANHATHAVLLATNFFGINTIPIALNEADYARMWAQAATVMSTYQAVAGSAVAAAPQSTPAPQILKSNAVAATSNDSSSTDHTSEIEKFLDQIGYSYFYNKFLLPLENLPLPQIFQGMLAIDPYLPYTGNPIAFFAPTNIAFALGYPMTISQFVAYLSQTFAFISADITAAMATGNPGTIASTLLFTTVEAVGTVITDVIALLKSLLEPTLALLPAALPLLTAPLTPLALAPFPALGGLAGLSGLAGLHGIPSVLAPVPPPVAPLAMGPTPTPTPTPTPALTAAPAPAAPLAPPTPGPPPPAPPPPLTPVDGMSYMNGLNYLVGGLSVDARRAAATGARKKKSPEPDTAEAPAATATTQQQAPRRRRRTPKDKQLGRGYEYMDLEPDTSPEDDPPTASEHGAGPLGFAGTAARSGADAPPAGLTTLASDSFGGGSTTPMMPSTWDHERD
jgi:PPE-repeat protein